MDKKNKRWKRMENLLGSLGWIMLAVTVFVVGFTVLTLNGILKMGIFESYLPIGMAIFIGLVIWGFRFYYNSRRYPSYLKYSIFSFIFALIQLIFLLSNVY